MKALATLMRYATGADSAVRLFAVVSFAIFMSEMLIMLALEGVGPMPVFQEALLDSTLLLALTFPILYATVFRPLRNFKAREQSQLALRQQEQQLRAVFDGTLDGLVVIDAKSREILAANRTISRMLGYAQSEMLNLGLSDIYPEDGVSGVADHFNRVVRGDFQMAISAPVLRKDGTVFFADIKASPIRYGGKDAVLGVLRDVSDRVAAEQRLVEAEAQFRGLVEQSIAGSYIIQDGKFAYVNPRAAEILGYDSAEALVGLDPLMRVAEKDRKKVRETMRARLEGEKQVVAHAFTALRRDGTMIEVGIHGARGVHRGRPAIIGLMQDITEKLRAEEEVKSYVAQLEAAFRSTVEVATSLGEMRDPYTAGHQRRVAGIAVAIGAALGFDVRRQEGLRVAGHLHDTGKIIIPAEILSKPGKLSAIEMQLVSAHSQAGYDVLKSVSFPWPVAQVALQHHERMDGSGYPQGLKGEAILLEARIVAVADVIEAMSSHRPYRPGLGIDAALAEIERGRGSLYDANVVDACLRLFREMRFQIPE